jgi:hypothetical protein
MSRVLPPGIRDELGIEEFTEDLLLRLGRVRDEAAPRVIAERHGNRPGTAHRWGLIACIVVVAAATVIVLRPVGPGTPPPVGGHLPTSAVVVLREAATVSARRRPLAPGQFLRVRMLRVSDAGTPGHPVIERSVWTNWMATDGSAQFLIRPVGPGSDFERSDTRCTPGHCVTRYADGSRSFAGPATYGPGNSAGFSAPELQRLPADPAGLVRDIEERAARADDRSGYSGDPWEAGYSLLVSPIQPDVRAALYRAFAMLPGVRVLGRERVEGRSGVALERRVSGIPGIRLAGWRVIVVDPLTGDLLAARGFYTRGHVTDRRFYTVSVVSSMSG